MGDQNLTEAQRNIKDAIARAPTGEDSGLTGMIATNTYSGENSAQAQQKKREKEAFQRVLNQSVQDQINAQIRDLQGQVKQHEKNINTLDNAIGRIQSGEDPQDVVKDPDIKALIKNHEKRTGKKVDPKAPDFENILIAIKAQEINHLDLKKAAIEDIRKIEFNDPDASKKLKAVMEKLPEEQKIGEAANIDDDRIREKALEASGNSIAGISDSLEVTRDLYDDAGTSSMPNFEEIAAPSFFKASVATEIDGESVSLSDKAIKDQFTKAVQNEVTEQGQALDLNDTLKVAEQKIDQNLPGLA